MNELFAVSSGRCYKQIRVDFVKTWAKIYKNNNIKKTDWKRDGTREKCKNKTQIANVVSVCVCRGEEAKRENEKKKALERRRKKKNATEEIERLMSKKYACPIFMVIYPISSRLEFMESDTISLNEPRIFWYRNEQGRHIQFARNESKREKIENRKTSVTIRWWYAMA